MGKPWFLKDKLGKLRILKEQFLETQGFWNKRIGEARFLKETNWNTKVFVFESKNGKPRILKEKSWKTNLIERNSLEDQAYWKKQFGKPSFLKKQKQIFEKPRFIDTIWKTCNSDSFWIWGEGEGSVAHSRRAPCERKKEGIPRGTLPFWKKYKTMCFEKVTIPCEWP